MPEPDGGGDLLHARFEERTDELVREFDHGSGVAGDVDFKLSPDALAGHPPATHDYAVGRGANRKRFPGRRGRLERDTRGEVGLIRE